MSRLYGASCRAKLYLKWYNKNREDDEWKSVASSIPKSCLICIIISLEKRAGQKDEKAVRRRGGLPGGDLSEGGGRPPSS